MEEYIEALALGLVQGIAEFLPISSSGHLTILQALFADVTGNYHSAEDNLRMNIAVHLGTLFSILTIFRREVWQLLSQPSLCLKVILATIPVGVIGLAFKDALEQMFNTPLLVGCTLFITAGLLLAGQKLEPKPAEPTPDATVPPEFNLSQVTWWQALLVGLFQGVAILPGVSRSGSTIAGGLIAGMPRQLAAKFSFLIALPAIAGASVVAGKDLLLPETPTVAVASEQTTPAASAESPVAPAPNSLPALLVGAVTAFFVGLVSLTWLLRVIARGKLHWFAWYCIAVGAATIVWQLPS